MTETTEATLARTFGWETPEARLYRECPTAFWLAPDGDGVLPAPRPGPLPQVAAPAPAPMETDKTQVDGMPGAIFLATLSAGPVFTATALLLAGDMGANIWYTPVVRAVSSLAVAPFTILVGVSLSIIPVLAGVLILGTAGTWIRAVRTPWTWVATGAAMGAGMAACLDAGGSIGLALIATSVACAAIARRFVTWQDHQAA